MIVELMDRFVEFATTWLWLVMLATWRALPLLVLAVGIGLVLRRKLTPSLHALLLTIVVIRLLIPISIGSPLSLHKPIDNWFSSKAVESAKQPPHAHAQAHGFMPNLERAPAQVEWVPVEAQSAVNSIAWEEILLNVILLIVVSVTIGLILRSVFSHVRFAICLRSCRVLDDQPLIDLLLRECDSLAVGRRPVLREVPTLTAPAVFGLFRQTICLPLRLTETLSEQELRWVIRHELAHIRRRDIPVVIVASIASAFHWFNPIVWVIESRLRAAMEAAADRLALQSLSQNEVPAYGKLLLRFAQESIAAKKSPTLGLISFASGRRLKQRVELLMRDSRPNGMASKFLAAGLVGAVALAGLTDARDAKDLKKPEVHLFSNDSTELQVQPLWLGPLGEEEMDGPTYVETYDLTYILETVPKALKSDFKTPLEQLTNWIPLQPWMKEKLHVDGETLSAELTASQHQLLKQTLDVWKDGEPGQITIEARFIQTTTKTASSIDWAGRRIDGLTVRGLGPAIAARIDEPELTQLVRTVSADPRGNILLAPKVTLFDGQPACIADQVRRPFITGVDPKADGRMQPVVSLVDEGLSFFLTPKAGDDNSVTLSFKVKASSIGKVSFANLPIRTSNNAKAPFTVQVPATEQYEVSSSVKLAAGESVVVAIPRVFNDEPGADAETTMIVALTPRIIDVVDSSVATEPNNQ
jgi:beta-lactamase regulating signal transducer with metallopeptidase domain